MTTWLDEERVGLVIACSLHGFNDRQGQVVVSLKRNFTLIAQYWLIPGTDSKVCLKAYSFLQNRANVYIV
jgi:hypothetical protein